MFYSILLLYVLYSGYNALKQEPIFEINDNIPKEESTTIKKNIESYIDQKLKETLKKDLLEKMESDKLYLNSSLTINTLSNAINSNNKYVSQLINNDFNKNFVMFVNSYRIREAKKYY
jgi:YesN/AraC family two-component response regulator